MPNSPSPPPPRRDTTTSSNKRDRTATADDPLDLTEDDAEAEHAAKRFEGAEVLTVKDEDVDPVIPPWAGEEPIDYDIKPNVDELKPELRVDCESTAHAEASAFIELTCG